MGLPALLLCSSFLPHQKYRCRDTVLQTVHVSTEEELGGWERAGPGAGLPEAAMFVATPLSHSSVLQHCVLKLSMAEEGRVGRIPIQSQWWLLFMMSLN